MRSTPMGTKPRNRTSFCTRLLMTARRRSGCLESSSPMMMCFRSEYTPSFCIIEAFSALKADLQKDGVYSDLKLIIIGDELSKHPDLRRAVIKSRVQNDVRFLGFVPIGVLRIFYDLAKIFVFPSLYEGFGLPPLEAMAHSTPVVTSNTSSIPEVVGDAAVMVNPENVFEIAHALHRVLLDQGVREKLKSRGMLRAQKFSWDDSVRRMLAVYHEVVEK